MSKVKRQCKVLIVGCGTAGICAAVSASRLGANVLLIEKNSHPGGAAVVGLHRFICGLYKNDINKPKTTLNEGLAREIHNRLKVLSPYEKITRIGRVNVLPFTTKNIVAIYRALLDKKKIDIFFNTKVVSVATDKNSIKSVRVQSKKSTCSINPKVVIDCSGSGIVVRQSGVKYRLAPLAQLQLATYSFKVSGLRVADDALAVKVPYYINQAVIEKKLPAYLKYTTFYSCNGTNSGIIKLSMPPAKGTRGTSRAKRDARRAHRYLALHLPSFERSYIAGLSSEVLDREGIRAQGGYTLTADDIIKARKFSDGVVKNAWPIEIWDQKRGPRYRYVAESDYYEIPLRCLKVKDISNLYCAGRCISVSHEALGSTRVMGPCISLGEQAGIAAARYASNC